MIVDTHVHVWEIDPPKYPIGPTAPNWTALPDEPAHVALIRLERENELTAKLNAASIALQREKKRSALLERELSAVTGQNSQFIQQLGGEITAGLLQALARISHEEF